MNFSVLELNKNYWFILGIVFLLVMIMTVVYVWYSLIQERSAKESELRKTFVEENNSIEEINDSFKSESQELEKPATAPEILNSKGASGQSKLGQPMDKSILR